MILHIHCIQIDIKKALAKLGTIKYKFQRKKVTLKGALAMAVTLFEYNPGI